MSRAERLAKAEAIYKGLKGPFDQKYAEYETRYEAWYTENKEAIEYNKTVSWHSKRDVPARPYPPQESELDREALIAIMSELAVSKDMAKEYLAVAKYRAKK